MQCSPASGLARVCRMANPLALISPLCPALTHHLCDRARYAVHLGVLKAM
jgi:hypothetical protein